MSSDRVVFIAPVPSISKRTRLAKMARVVRVRDLSIEFFGWEREAGELAQTRNSDPQIKEQRLLRGGGYASSRARMLYPVWMLLVFWRVLLLGRRPVIFALGWETAFPARLAAYFTRARIVFDDADRFSMILRLPRPFHSLLQRAERWLSGTSEMHIVPSFSRYEWENAKMTLLRNSPLSADFDEAKRLGKPKAKTGLNLYANGWIGETRGAPVFLRMLDKAHAADVPVRMIIAGRVDGDSAPNLISHPLVDYLGEVSQSKALSIYCQVDAVLTYYDPQVAINRKAESNKWGDAVYFDCPIIVNEEVETGRHFVEKGAGWSVPYADDEELLELCSRLASSPQDVSDKKENLKNLKEDYPVFDLQFDRILSAVLNAR